MIIVLALILIVAAFGSMIIIYARSYKKVPPNKAMVVYGRRTVDGKGYMIITGGGKFIVPIIEKYKFMDLKIHNINLELDRVKTAPKEARGRIRIYITAAVKIPSDPKILYTAMEHLLDKPESEIKEIASKVIEGHTRQVCGTLTYDEIDYDPDIVANKICQQANRDLNNMGLQIRVLLVEDVKKIG